MGRLSASILALALGLAAAIALVSCGGGESADLLPGSTASQITSNLDQVEQLAGEGECVGAENAAAEVSNQVESLTGIDTKLKQALSEGAARLNEVVAACEEATTEEPLETEESLEEAEAEEDKEKEEEKAEKEAEKAEKKNEEKPKKEEESEESTEGPTLPPSKGNEESGGPPSGGVGPGAPKGGD
jgi:peptidoglycan hydrolase CwlO-like protein